MKEGISVKKQAPNAIEALRKCLQSIKYMQPFVCEDRAFPSDSTALPDDRLLDLVTPLGSWRLLLASLTNGEPRQIRSAVTRIASLTKEISAAHAILYAPYVSPKGAEICEEAGVGYVDSLGNCRLRLGPAMIWIEGYRPPATKRPLKTLFAPKTERILRALLDDPNRSWKLQELADVAQVSLGQVAKVKKKLLDLEWVQAARGELRLARPDALLAEWRSQYDDSRNRPRHFYTMLPLSEFETRLAELCARSGRPWALAGFSAAARLAPHVRYSKAMAYLDDDHGAIAEALKLKEVSSGANVMLLSPYDEGVYLGSRDVNGVRVTSPIQTYLDVGSLKGRGEEAAKFLLDHEIRPSWS